MRKTKTLNNIRFGSTKIKEICDIWLSITPKDKELANNSKSLDFGNEKWDYDNDSEFFSDCNKDYEMGSLLKSKFTETGHYSLSLNFSSSKIFIAIEAPTRHEIEDVFSSIEHDLHKYLLTVDDTKEKPTIFIGHGHSNDWRDLKDHLADKHGYRIEAYETGARAGHTIRDILEDMLTKSSMAILVMTGEDELSDGQSQARPNVIHEIGLFQGKLGFSKAIVLLEEGTNEFSNLYGIQQIRYKNIKETYGEILATIRREF